LWRRSPTTGVPVRRPRQARPSGSRYPSDEPGTTETTVQESPLDRITRARARPAPRLQVPPPHRLLASDGPAGPTLGTASANTVLCEHRPAGDSPSRALTSDRPVAGHLRQGPSRMSPSPPARRCSTPYRPVPPDSLDVIVEWPTARPARLPAHRRPTSAGSLRSCHPLFRIQQPRWRGEPPPHATQGSVGPPPERP
jgi:hypothetical protein